MGAFVNPSSTDKHGCDKNDIKGLSLDLDGDTTVTWTYDVTWVESEIQWGSRWDHYLSSYDSKVHWFSVFNSAIVVFLLSAVVFSILLRALRRDITRYNDIDIEENEEEFGWKLIHGDIFRAPIHRMFLSVFIGNGLQMLMMCAVTISIFFLTSSRCLRIPFAFE